MTVQSIWKQRRERRRKIYCKFRSNKKVVMIKNGRTSVEKKNLSSDVWRNTTLNPSNPLLFTYTFVPVAPCPLQIFAPQLADLLHLDVVLNGVCIGKIHPRRWRKLVFNRCRLRQFDSDRVSIDVLSLEYCWRYFRRVGHGMELRVVAIEDPVASIWRYRSKSANSQSVISTERCF